MAHKAIRKQLFYKQAIFLRKSDLTLQHLFARAIKKLRVANRQEVPTTSHDDAVARQWVRFVNSPRKFAGFEFGVLTQYSPGTHHMVIDLDVNEEKDELDVSKYPPPAGKQFTEPLLFFGVRDNHVVCIQSKTLRAGDLESHLNWLLKAAGCLDVAQHLQLSDVIPSSTRKKLQKAPIKSISIGVPLIQESASQALSGRKVSSAINRVAKGVGLDMLKGILSAEEFSALKIEELTEVPDIQVNLEVKVVGRSKSNFPDDKVMKRIMRELRHVEDPSFLKIDVLGMGKIDGTAFRVQAYKTVDSHDGVLDTADAYDVLRAWLESLIDTGDIEVD